MSMDMYAMGYHNVASFNINNNCLHKVLTKADYSLFSWAWSAVPYPGGVENDFLEVPSMMFEQWCAMFAHLSNDDYVLFASGFGSQKFSCACHLNMTIRQRNSLWKLSKHFPNFANTTEPFMRLVSRIIV